MGHTEHISRTLRRSRLPTEGAQFQSDDPDRARSIVADIFCSHELRVQRRGAAPAFRMDHVRFGRNSSLNLLQYGTAVTVEPGEMQSVFNVQIQLSGTTLTKCGGSEHPIGPGQAGVLSPTCHVSMDWTEDSAMLIYSVAREAVESTLQSLLDGYLHQPIIFDSQLDLSDDRKGGFHRSLKFLQSELSLNGRLLSSPLAADHFEQLLILSLLYDQPHNYTDFMGRGLSPAAPVHVKRVEDYIQENAHLVITIEELTSVSGVSSRSLFEGFKRFRGTSPMRYLRDVRFERARRDLLGAADAETVTDIALRWGFTQLGRFSVEYKARYGESPSDTLRFRT